jgi:hypothetical protein
MHHRSSRGGETIGLHDRRNPPAMNFFILTRLVGRDLAIATSKAGDGAWSAISYPPTPICLKF